MERLKEAKLFMCSKQGDCKKELYLGTLFFNKTFMFFGVFSPRSHELAKVLFCVFDNEVVARNHEISFQCFFGV
jgi:hypothetical protein